MIIMTHFSYLSNNVSLELTELDKIETFRVFIDCHLVAEVNLSSLCHLRFGEYVLVYAIQGVKQ